MHLWRLIPRLDVSGSLRHIVGFGIESPLRKAHV